MVFCWRHDSVPLVSMYSPKLACHRPFRKTRPPSRASRRRKLARRSTCRRAKIPSGRGAEDRNSFKLGEEALRLAGSQQCCVAFVRSRPEQGIAGQGN